MDDNAGIIHVSSGDHAITTSRASPGDVLLEGVTIEAWAKAMAAWAGEPGFEGNVPATLPSSVSGRDALIFALLAVCGERPPRRSDHIDDQTDDQPSARRPTSVDNWNRTRLPLELASTVSEPTDGLPPAWHS